MMTRRQWIRSGLLAGGGLFAPAVFRDRCQLLAGSSERYSRHAIELVERSLVIDMLGLVTLDWRKQRRWFSDPNTFSEQDFDRLRSSAISVFHPAVRFYSSDPARKADQFFCAWSHFLESQGEYFLRIQRPEDLLLAKSGGQVGVVLGLQNSDHLGSVDDVDRYHALGQRISQLTYNGRNRLGSGCLEPRDSGLTEYGAAVVQRMNEVGMGIDVSHCGPRTTLEAFEASSRPVLITHSNCSALVPGHPRCKSDEILRKMARNGGVIGITCVRAFLSRRSPVTIEHVLDHFEHVARLVGVEHVGIGSDADVESRDPLTHSRRIYDLVEGLIRRGFSDPSIELILGGNFARALKDIWAGTSISVVG